MQLVTDNMILFSLILCLPALFKCDLVPPCRLDNQKCVDRAANEVANAIMRGIPSMGIPPSDPLSIPIAGGNVSILKLIFTNSTITGFGSCILSNVKLDLKKLSLKFDMNCPRLAHEGLYEMSGRLILLPIEGIGTYSFYTGKFYIGMEAQVEKVRCASGKTYLQVKNFNFNVRPDEPVYFDFKNLFNGQKDLSDAVHKFAHENYKEVIDLTKGPVMTPDFKKIFSRVNKFLKNIAIEDFVLN